MAVTVSQAEEGVNLVWVEGDPISLAFSVADVDWSGTYTAQVRAGYGTTYPSLLALTVTATFDTPDTDFTLTATGTLSAAVPAGRYVWDLQQTGGVTRLGGVVTVRGQVTQ